MSHNVESANDERLELLKLYGRLMDSAEATGLDETSPHHYRKAAVYAQASIRKYFKCPRVLAACFASPSLKEILENVEMEVALKDSKGYFLATLLRNRQ